MTAAADPTPETPTDDVTEATPVVPETTDTDTDTDDDAAVVDDVAVDIDAATTEVEVEVTEPEAAEPEPSEPAAAEAEAAGAEVTEPDPTEPEPTEPEPTEPEPTEPEPTQPEATAPAPVPAPSPLPRPVPRPMPRPAAPASASAEPVAPASTSGGEPWGRVAEDGTVSVREADGWREVGQYPDGTSEEALAYFERKFADLASEVALLEARHRRGGAPAADLRSTARALHDKLQGAAAVGDLAALDARVAALTEQLSAASETEAAAAREAVDAAVVARTALVEQAEALAAKDPRSVQWKQASAELTSLFDQWQSQQQNGPRLPKATGQKLWKRFRDARATVDKHRREFYSELDGAHKAVRDQKSRLVERAEALGPQGEDGIATYRELLDQWKTAGRAGKKADDALWARFKAAGDALYAARGEREAADAEESREKIVAKRALLDEAKSVADEPDLAKARAALTNIQRQWDDIGRIFPRDKERTLDDDLRKIEQSLRGREENDWKRNNPETKARANDMTRQLTDAIQKLEDELALATTSGNASAIAKATEALDARRAWLNALGG